MFIVLKVWAEFNKGFYHNVQQSCDIVEMQNTIFVVGLILTTCTFLETTEKQSNYKSSYSGRKFSILYQNNIKFLLKYIES